MSVVNKMLNDLEQRQSVPSTADYIPHHSSRTKQLLITAAFVCLMAILLSATYVTLYSGQMAEENVNEDSALPTELDYSPEKGDQLTKTAEQESEHSPALDDVETKGAVEKIYTVEKVDELEKNSELQTTKATVDKQTMDSVQSQGNSQVSKQVQPSLASNVVKRPESEKVNKTLSVAPSSGLPRQLSSLKEQARLALENGNSEKAITKLMAAVELAPDDKTTLKKLASLQYAEKAVADAFNTLQLGLLKFPDDSSMRLMQARIAFKQGDKNLALSVLYEHPKTAIASDELLSFRAALAEKTGDYTTAYADYGALVDRQPQNAKWWLGLAVCQDKLSLSQDALHSYQQVQVLNQLPSQVHDFVSERIQLLARQS